MPRFPISVWIVPFGLVGLACANDPETVEEENEQNKTHAVITVERTDPASPDAEGNASAVARFVSVPAFTNPARVLGAAGLTVDLPALDACLGSDGVAELEPPLASQDPVELVEAGDVTVTAADATTALVPHAFPTVGAFASGVLYATRDRTSAALPAAVPYAVAATGSASVPALRIAAEAPGSPLGVEVAGTPLRELGELRTGHAMELSWTAGDAADVVYVELLAYDGSPSVLCAFRDDAGAGTIPADAFSGAGTGRIAVHRMRSHHFDGATSVSEMRFDFQVGVAVEFVK